MEKMIEEMVDELKKVVSFKDSTIVGDIVLILAVKPQMLTYALVVDIARDENKRDEWWHVTFQVLSIPPQKLVWTLREPQLTGKETFTMGGEGRFVKAVDFRFQRPASPGGGEKVKKTAKPVLKRIK